MKPGNEDEGKASHSDQAEKGSTTAEASFSAASASTSREPEADFTAAQSARSCDIIFEAWKGSDGLVSGSKLWDGVKKVSGGAELSGPALSGLKLSTSQRLNKQELKALLDRLVVELQRPLASLAEALVLAAKEARAAKPPETPVRQGSQDKAEELAKQDRYIRDLAQDKRVEQLFTCFNRSGSGQMSFSELSHALYHLQQGTSLQEARSQAVNTMLLCDTHSKRSLGREEFARFLLKLGVLLHTDAGELAETLFQVVQEGQGLPTLDDSATAFSMDTRDGIAQVYETLADRKLHLLFELWDKDGDGMISFAELALGLRKFSSAAEPVTEAAADAAEALLLFDADTDQKLDRAEFARFVNMLCESCSTDFDTLSEFLILLAALEDNPSEELAFLLSEVKVDRAVASLGSSWKKGVSPVSSTAAARSHAEPDGKTAGASQHEQGADVTPPPALQQAAKDAVIAELGGVREPDGRPLSGEFEK